MVEFFFRVMGLGLDWGRSNSCSAVARCFSSCFLFRVCLEGQAGRRGMVRRRILRGREFLFMWIFIVLRLAFMVLICRGIFLLAYGFVWGMWD